MSRVLLWSGEGWWSRSNRACRRSEPHQRGRAQDPTVAVPLERSGAEAVALLKGVREPPPPPPLRLSAPNCFFQIFFSLFLFKFFLPNRVDIDASRVQDSPPSSVICRLLLDRRFLVREQRFPWLAHSATAASFFRRFSIGRCADIFP